MNMLTLKIMAGGAALALTLAAQGAEARSATGPIDNGSGPPHPIAVQPVGNLPNPSQSYVEFTGRTADNVAVEVTTIVENGEELLQPGEVIEVEIDLDDVVAYLKSNEHEAVILAAETDVRPYGQRLKTEAGSNASKLSDAEIEAVARRIMVNTQSGGTARGRSDPATGNTSRLQATAQAWGRIIANTIRRAFPNVRGRVRYTDYHPNGQVRSRTEADFEFNGPLVDPGPRESAQ